jgi:glycosyltransferase involved in cell wall biosynthesis
VRLLFDALSSTAKSGGMTIHGLETIGSWAEQFPNDELWVICPTSAVAAYSKLHVKTISLETRLLPMRVFAQLLLVPLITIRLDPDFVISLNPLMSPFVPRQLSIVYEHDWRHLRNPKEFPTSQKFYRRLWKLSAKRARLCICISSKAERETQKEAPSAHTIVVENGRDHAARWGVTRCEVKRTIVTFGHHSNKRPDMVIRAFSLIAPEIRDGYSLVILGTQDSYATTLAELAEKYLIADSVELPGFVTDEEYRALVSSARVIVMASSDEGFGLPIAEAQYFGIPCVLTVDSGVGTLFGDYPILANPSSEDLARALTRALTQVESCRLKRKELWTWADASAKVRETLDALGD